ncbi:LysM peptidoglycan-binding domain-containing protein [Streptomyces antnestii]|uniref:LysM peptidoglycan-binding domain-containing protein n=1 Tax=Streptomyces antnestii TaxID=2494256 RepID=A0A437NYS9_9ACTN|nr:LysM peptidoglycan-binding domain-containing protein [Streptomyces sp. San01]RVU15120.1 LysM peptidoglycan-binding domain-containing protein [Streptomyces sp. San01]
MPRNAAPAGAGRTIAAVLRALASLVVLATAIVGLPLLLIKATPVVWATSHDDLAHLIDRQDTGGAFLLLLIAVAWIGWATFTACTVREIPAQLRGRTWHAPRGLGSSQRLAAVLVGSILVLLPTGTALATPATATPAATATHVPAQAPHAPEPRAQAQPATTVAADDASPHYTVREVRPAESLWSIAERELGDGERWRDIAALNDGRTMADGSVFHASTFLQPGWQLRMPDDANAAGANAPAAQGEGAQSVTVQPGGTLWGIAETEMGDGAKYHEIFEANKGATQPGGTTLTDPDDIRPGLKLDIPQPPTPHAPAEKAKPHPTTPAGPDESAGAGSGAGEGAGAGEGSGAGETRPAPHESGQKTKAPSAPAQTPEHKKPEGEDRGEQLPAAPHTAAPQKPTAVPSASAQPSKDAPTAPASTPQDDTTSSEDTAPSPVGLREGAGIGMLLAGSLVAAVGIKRLLQRRRRQPGETIAMAAQPTPLEQVLEASAEPGSVELLDTALRTLNHHAQQEGRALPAIRGARITHRTLELLLDADTEAEAGPIRPFVEHKYAPHCWSLDRTQELLDHDQARATAAPYPGLTTIGTDPDGNHLLLNLPAAQVLLLDGDIEAVRDTARALALEAATSTWSDRADILTIGLGTELPTQLPQGRLRAVPHLRAAQRDLGELLLEHHQSADEDGTVPLPWMLICAAEAAAGDAQHLADALTAARHLPLALVLPAHDAQQAFPHAERLAVGSPEPVRSDLLDTDVLVQSMTDSEYEDLVGVLATAEEPARPAEGPWQLVPAVTLDKRGHSPASPSAVPDAPFAALTAPTPLRVMPPPQPADTATHAPATTRSTEPVPALAEPALAEADDDQVPEAVELHAPDIQVLGPVTVAGIEASGHGFKLALLAALLYFKPGISSDTACEAMDPRKPWSKATLQSRISELRNRLGTDADGSPFLPRDRSGTYRLSPKARCDWTRFTQLAERGLAKGPEAGIADLEAALDLVRGRPFGGADLAWAAARIQEMLVRITDVAHTLATWHRTAPRPDLTAARRTVTRGLDIDDSAEILYQDWMLIEDQAGNRAGVSAAYETLRGINQRLEIGMESETEKVFDTIMSRTAS